MNCDKCLTKSFQADRDPRVRGPRPLNSDRHLSIAWMLRYVRQEVSLMNRVLVGCILVAVAVSLWPAQTFAQSPTPSSGCEQLAELTVAIHDLVSELRDANTRESHHRNLLIAIQYLQFRSRSIESLEEEVRRTQDRKDSTADIIERSADELDAMREKLAELTGEEANEMRSAIERFERRSESFEAAIDRYERKIVDLENQILESRRQLLALEDYVIENLNLEP